ncbi:MAG: ABC transporter permease [Bacteroidota bacterium]|nr:ABC transporter permease [Bacteroidota bacterium]
MNKILLIIQREYLTRVRKKSFIIMTILGPLLFAGSFAAIIWLGSKDGDEKVVDVLDESSLFEGKFNSTGNLKFKYISSGLEEAKENLSKSSSYGILYIPVNLSLDDPKGIVFFAEGNPSVEITSSITRTLKNEIEDLKLTRSGLDREVLAKLKTDVTVSTINLSDQGEAESNALVASAVGYVSSFLIYMFIFIYGTQIMRGVVEEKSNRIVEVIISSVKPFQLMLGKIIGIACVGLTQFLLWIILTTAISLSVLAYFQNDVTADGRDLMENVSAAQGNMQSEHLEQIVNAFDAINFPYIIACFIFFFLGGYLLYGALFAAIGSAVDSDADTQQFMFPIVIPLVFAIASLAVVLRDPDGSFAFWMSMIPFTSPVVMMMRLSFNVPEWQLFCSMFFLVLGFIFTTWLAGRIYRIGILSHGTKINYRVLGKWLFMRN